MGVAPAERKFLNQSAIDKSHTIGNKDVNFAAALQHYDNLIVYPAASPCKSDNSDMRGIQRVIKNLQNGLSTIQRFSNINSAVDALINENAEPGKTIKKILNIATGDISGYVKNIMGRVRGWVLNGIHNNAKKALPFLFPGEVPSFIDKLNKGINGLSCAFAKIVRGLAKTVGQLLMGLIDKYVNGPMCLAEDFVGSLLDKITNPISSAINSVNALLGSVVGAISGIAGSLFNAIDFVTGILNFFKCDDDMKCPTQHELSRSGDGADTNSTGGSVSSTTQLGKFASGDGVGNSGTGAGVDARVASGGDADFGTSAEAKTLLEGGSVGNLTFQLE